MTLKATPFVSISEICSGALILYQTQSFDNDWPTATSLPGTHWGNTYYY